MIYSLVQTVAPTAEPVTATEAMQWARVNDTGDTALVTDLITAAREYVEEVTKRQLMPATYVYGIDLFPFGSPDIRFIWNRFGVIRVPKPPLQSVTSIVYTAPGGGSVVHPSNLYQVDTAREPGRIAPAFSQVWPIPQYTTFNAVAITFVAGYADAAHVPSRIKAAIKMVVSNCYWNREATVEQAANELPAHFRSFLRSAGTAEYA